MGAEVGDGAVMVIAGAHWNTNISSNIISHENEGDGGVQEDPLPAIDVNALDVNETHHSHDKNQSSAAFADIVANLRPL